MREYPARRTRPERWRGFVPRPGDVVIATPSKCGTTWLQQLVGMLLLDRVDLGAPLHRISPWFDAAILGDDEAVAIVEAQQHRRFVKTHLPLDGLPRHDVVTYLTIFRHPLDVALSFRDHKRHMDRDGWSELSIAASGIGLAGGGEPQIDDDADHLRWWIADDGPPSADGPRNLADYANALRVAWSLADDANVHLFRYDDLVHDLPGQIERLATVLGVEPGPDRVAEFAAAATFDSMRARAEDLTPYADHGLWSDAGQFFQRGGDRGWRTLLSTGELDGMERRLTELAGRDAAAWALGDADPGAGAT